MSDSANHSFATTATLRHFHHLLNLHLQPPSCHTNCKSALFSVYVTVEKKKKENDASALFCAARQCFTYCMEMSVKGQVLHLRVCTSRWGILIGKPPKSRAINNKDDSICTELQWHRKHSKTEWNKRAASAESHLRKTSSHILLLFITRERQIKVWGKTDNHGVSLPYKIIKAEMNCKAFSALTYSES